MIIRVFVGSIVGLAAVFGAWVRAQTPPTTARVHDVQTACALSRLPAAERLTVSWTGECVAGVASGVGDVFAFSDGVLQYILRGQFRDGALERTDSVRTCQQTLCADDVPPSVVRRHQAAALRQPLAPPKDALAKDAVAPALDGAAPLPPALNEVHAPDGVYRGKVYVDPRTGVLSGEVRVEYLDGRRFEGVLDAGRKQGVGTHTWVDGQRYSGGWRDDLPHGRGTLTFVNGDVYEGDFVDGERTGQGALKQQSGNAYVGQWLRGVRDGLGVEEWPDGQRYEGGWKGNRRDGQGRMRFADGGTYEGDWKADRADGQGDIRFANGDVYSGQVRDGAPHGTGRFSWGSGDRFEGEFESGAPTARGTLTFLAEDVAASPPGADAVATVQGVAVPTAPTPAAAATAATVATGASVAGGLVAPAVSTAPPSRTTLCSMAFNAARSLPALRRFIDSFPDDECARHALARKKIAVWEEQARAASREQDERAAAAKAFIGAPVAFRQEFSFCVNGSGAASAACQPMVYWFDVRAKIREIDLQRRVVQVQIVQVVAASASGSGKGAPSPAASAGQAAALAAYKSRYLGATVSKTLAEVGLVF